MFQDFWRQCPYLRNHRHLKLHCVSSKAHRHFIDLHQITNAQGPQDSVCSANSEQLDAFLCKMVFHYSHGPLLITAVLFSRFWRSARFVERDGAERLLQNSGLIGLHMGAIPPAFSVIFTKPLTLHTNGLPTSIKSASSPAQWEIAATAGYHHANRAH